VFDLLAVILQYLEVDLPQSVPVVRRWFVVLFDVGTGLGIVLALFAGAFTLNMFSAPDSIRRTIAICNLVLAIGGTYWLRQWARGKILEACRSNASMAHLLYWASVPFGGVAWIVISWMIPVY
jgi:hypothetical protein